MEPFVYNEFIMKCKPQNKLQELAFKKGYQSSTEFAKALEAANVTSYGTAFSKWHSGRAEKTQYDILLKISNFLGAASVEQVFDP